MAPATPADLDFVPCCVLKAASKLYSTLTRRSRFWAGWLLMCSTAGGAQARLACLGAVLGTRLSLCVLYCQSSAHAALRHLGEERPILLAVISTLLEGLGLPSQWLSKVHALCAAADRRTWQARRCQLRQNAAELGQTHV